MISEGLYNLLINDAGILSLISQAGSPPFPQVYFNSLRKGYSLPAIVMHSASSNPVVTNDGTAALNYETFGFDCLASDSLVAQRLKLAVKQLLDDYRGPLIEGTQLVSTVLKGEFDNPFEEGKGGFVNRCVVNIKVGYTDQPLPFPVTGPGGPVVPEDDDTNIPIDGGSF